MLATSMLTIFGVVFSIVIVALTLASSQFGSRLIRTFLSDTIDQIAVGTFISTFVYCLLVMRTVGGDKNGAFVPHVSVSIAILLALSSLGVLIYFINHLSVSLQASYIIATVGADLKRTIMAIEQLRAGLCCIAERSALSSVILDAEGVQRLFVKRQDAAHTVEAAFSLIRQHGRENLEVTISLLDALEQIARRTTDVMFRGALQRQATLVGHGAQSALPEEADPKQVAARFQRLLGLFPAEPPPGDAVTTRPWPRSKT